MGRPTKVPGKKIPVYVSARAWGDMMDHTDKVENEIGGVFRVREHNGALFIDDVKMLKQRAASDELHLSTDVHALDTWLSEQGWGDGECVYANWGQWHSHAAAAVGRSSEDEDAIKEYVTHGWYVTLIVNKGRNVHCSVDTLAGGNTLAGSVQLTFDGEFSLYAPLSEERQIALALEREREYVEYKKNVVVRSKEPLHSQMITRNGWTNDAYPSHRLDTTRMACMKCQMVRALCKCNGHAPLVSTEWEDVAWPRKGRIPAGIRRDGFRVRFHLPGDMTLTMSGGDTIHWLYGERSREMAFFRALGVNKDVVKRFETTGMELKFISDGTFSFMKREAPAGWED